MRSQDDDYEAEDVITVNRIAIKKNNIAPSRRRETVGVIARSAYNNVRTLIVKRC